MIELTYEHMNTTTLEKTMGRLYDDRTTPRKVAYYLMKYSKDVFPAYKKAKQVYSAMLADYAERTETGEFKSAGGEAVIKPECRQSYDMAMDAFLKTTVKVLQKKLHVTDFDTMELSAADLAALEPFVDGLDELA